MDLYKNKLNFVKYIYIHFFNNALYTVTMKYRELIPIKGFNSNFVTPVEFQPMWFNLAGLILLVMGIIMLVKGLKKPKPALNKR